MMTDSDPNWTAGTAVVGGLAVLSTANRAGAARGALLTGADAAGQDRHVPGALRASEALVRIA